jgi:hypothetical protein
MGKFFRDRLLVGLRRRADFELGKSDDPKIRLKTDIAGGSGS